MARKPITSERLESLRAEALLEWAGPPKAKKRSMWNQEAARQDLDGMIRTQDWRTARPQHFVELYMRMHGQVYGTPPLELRAKGPKLAAASMAARVMRELFDGSPDAMADFVRWVWQRQAREQKLRREGLKESDFRVTWRYQFSAKLVTDYRRDSMARGGR